MSRTPEARKPGKRTRPPRSYVPAAYPRLLVEFAVERGMPMQQVLIGTRVGGAQLHDPDARITARDAVTMTRNVVRHTGCAGIGFEIGLRTKPTAHGLLGYAAISSGTVFDAIGLFTKYARLLSADVSLRMSVENQTAMLEAVELRPLGPLRQTIYEGWIASFVTMGQHTVGDRVDGIELWFEWPEPSYFAEYRDRLPPARFSMPACQIRFPAEQLQRPLVLADPVAAKKLVEQCERELARVAPSADPLLRIRAMLSSGDSYPDLDALAARLFMSGRTLKRRLAEAGTSYQALLDDVRRRDALRLLANPELELAQIAGALGYSDPAHFTRAFKRWTGKTPTEMRAQLLAGA